MQNTKLQPLQKNVLPVWLGAFWVIQNVITRMGGWAMSSIRPITDREQFILYWPPQKPFWQWFERIWIAPFERWDTGHFIYIVSYGYNVGNASSQFHPLFPLFAAPFMRIGIPPLLSLVIISTLASFGSIWGFYKLAQLDLKHNTAMTATLLLFGSPFAFALFIPYSESLFILFAILTLYWCRLGRWWLAGISAGLATLTRQQGIFLFLPMIFEFWEGNGHSWSVIRSQFGVPHLKPSGFNPDNTPAKSSTNGWALFLAPAAYGAWVVFRAVAINDVSFDFSSFNNFLYSVLISPHAVKVVPVQAFLFPGHAFWLALRKLWFEPDYDIATNLVWGIYYLILLGISWKHIRVSYRVYCLTITLISFSYSTGSLHPYMGLVRHLLLGFPIFIGLAEKVKSPRSQLALTITGLLGYFQLAFSYYYQIWVP